MGRMIDLNILSKRWEDRYTVTNDENSKFKIKTVLFGSNSMVAKN